MDLSKQPKGRIPRGAASVKRLEKLIALSDEEKRRKKVYWVRKKTLTLEGEYILYDPDDPPNRVLHLNFNTPVWIFENYWYAYAYWLKNNPNGNQE